MKDDKTSTAGFAWRTRSGVGRTASPFGALRIKPAAVPPMMRIVQRGCVSMTTPETITPVQCVVYSNGSPS
jgi:hypothetical protein